ncbi:hypothetical protein JW948_09590 [bacterium]|nr:hypothetical protein [bacterium]
MQSNIRSNKSEILISLVFFTGFFLYVWLGIDPSLHYQSQQPVFFFGRTFLAAFLDYPGGLLDYAAAFLGQFFLFSWAGALIVTSAALALLLETRTMLGSAEGGPGAFVLPFIPAILLLAMQSAYNHPLAVSLGMVLAVGAFCVYMRSADRPALIRCILAGTLGLAVYYAAGGPFLLFAVMTAAHEMWILRQVPAGLAMLLKGAVIPFAAYHWVFMISVKDAFLIHVPLKSAAFAIMAGLFIILVPARLLLRTGSGVLGRESGQRTRIWHWMNRHRWILQTITITAAAAVAAVMSAAGPQKTVLKICQAARRSNWDSVLQLAQKENPGHILAQYQTNRALFHTGRLAEDLFDYPQTWGIRGLILPMEFNTAPLEKSDVSLEIGMLNEALRWAHESLIIVGFTPWTLQRLAVVSLLRGEREAARKYLNFLNRTLFFRAWAREHARYADDPARFAAAPVYRPLCSNINHQDFFIHLDDPLRDLESLSEANPLNRMAYEYLIAACLLTGRTSKLEKQMVRLRSFGFTRPPRPCREALFIHLLENDPAMLRASKALFGRDMFDNFQQFRTLLGQAKTERRDELLRRRFGNTYWYYVVQKNLKIQ